MSRQRSFLPLSDTPVLKLLLATGIVVGSVWVLAAQQSVETPLANAPPAPSTADQARIVEESRKVSIEYTTNLPNFVATQTVRRYERDKKGWKKLKDTVTLDVAYSKEGERYKLVSINGKATKKRLDNIDGFKSDGEFGTLLEWIFREKSDTAFEWQRWVSISGQPTHVLSYRIRRDRSEYKATFNSRSKNYHDVFGFSGLIYIDGETHRVMRITHTPEGIPPDWPITMMSGSLDYGFAEVGGKPSFVPRRADFIIGIRGQMENLNVIEFSNYKKFTTEAFFSFEKQ